MQHKVEMFDENLIQMKHYPTGEDVHVTDCIGTSTKLQ